MKYMGIALTMILIGNSVQIKGETMDKPLSNLKVAVLVADGFEESEMTEPRKALGDAGAKTTLISPAQGSVKSFKNHQWSQAYPVDLLLSKAHATDYDALLLPGGVMNPDTLRITPGAIEFIKHFVTTGKPIASICHGPWTLINAGGVRGHTMTSWPSLEADLRNAGANWVNKEVVTDGLLVTSRMPSDIPKFNEAMIALFSRANKKATSNS